MTMKLEEIRVGVYVNWVADRYLKSWDIVVKIVKFEEGRVTLLGFDDFRENEVSQDTVMEECRILSSAEIMRAANNAELTLVKKANNILIDAAEEAQEVLDKMQKFSGLFDSPRDIQKRGMLEDFKKYVNNIFS